MPHNVTIKNTYDFNIIKKDIISKYPTNQYNFSDTNTPFWNSSTTTQTKKKIWAILENDEKLYRANIKHVQHACDPGRNTTHTLVGEFVCYKLFLEKTHPFSYDIRYKIAEGKIQVTVLETQFGVPTHGGSSFRAHIQMLDSRLLLQCSVEDTFDGSYNVDCPVVFTRQCVRIQITREYHDFLAYVQARRDSPKGSFKKPVTFLEI